MHSKVDLLLANASKCLSSDDYRDAKLIHNKVININKNNKEAIEGGLISFVAKNYGNKYAKTLSNFRKNKLFNEDRIINMLKNISMDNSDDNENKFPKERLNGISYKEFTNILDKSNNIKKDIENVLFSTRIIIENKEDFISFVKLLFKNNMEDVVYEYIDIINKYFAYDESMREVLNIK